MSAISDRLRLLFDLVPKPDGRRWTLREAAEATGMSVSYLWRLRAGKTQNPTKAILERLARVFGVPVSFFTDEGPAVDAAVAQLRNRTDVERLISLGERHVGEGRWDEAEATLGKVINEARSAGDPQQAGRALRLAAQARRVRGDYAEARRLLTDALEQLKRVAGPGEELVQALTELAEVEYASEQYAEAYFQARRALAFIETMRATPSLQVDALFRAGVYARRIGRAEEALRYFEESWRLAQASQTGRPDAIVMGLGLAMVDLGRVQEAIEYFERARQLGSKLQRPPQVARAQHNLGVAHEQVGHWEEAVEAFTKSLGSHETLGDVQGVIHDRMELGFCYAQLGLAERALAHGQAAVALAQEHERPGDEARARLHLARVYETLREHEKSLQEYEAAVDAFERLGLRAELATAAVEYAELLARQRRFRQALDVYRRAVGLLLASPHPVRAMGAGQYLQTVGAGGM